MEQRTTILNSAIVVLDLLHKISSSVVIVLLHKILENLPFFLNFAFFFLYIVWVLLNERVTVISFIDFAREYNMIFHSTELAFC